MSKCKFGDLKQMLQSIFITQNTQKQQNWARYNRGTPDACKVVHLYVRKSSSQSNQ